jgi:hypothetical protein
MRNKKLIFNSVALTLGLLGLCYLALLWVAHRRIRQVDWAGLTELLKVPLGVAVTSPAVLQTQPEGGRQRAVTGWANASSEEIKGAAQQADTYVAAVEVRNAALGLLRNGAPLPCTSAELPNGKPGRRLDAWGNPFCLAEASGRIAVISAGPNAKGPPACSQVGISLRDLASLPVGKLYRYPSGALVLVAARR